MVNYYDILNVKRTASRAEIRSAYRRLARERHPDVNGGTEDAARDFALLALAYRTLSDPRERAQFDAQLEGRRTNSSVLYSNNPHARRARRMAMQAHFDRIINRELEKDRRENYTLQRAVFTTVSLFLSTFIVAMLKPSFWKMFYGYTGRVILVTLFLIGVWHLASRLRECIKHYTYQPKDIQDSLMQEDEQPDKPFTRFTAYSFLVVGCVFSVAAGLFAGEHVNYILNDMQALFDPHIRPDMLFYPPIAVLIVDTMHTVASRIDS